MINHLHTPLSLKQCAYPCNHKADRDVDNEMHYMSFLVVAKHMWSHHALKLRVEVREEVGVAQKNPVEKAYIVDFHAIKHCYKSCEEQPKPKLFLTPSQAARITAPANNASEITSMIQPTMLAPGNLCFLSGIASRFSFGAEEKNLLSWINATTPYKIRKYPNMIIKIATIVTAI